MLNMENWVTIQESKLLHCRIIYGDSREVLKRHIGEVDLIVTSPPYADARKKHYDSVHPDEFPEWFMTFHDGIYGVLKNEGSFVLNIKDRVVDGVRNHFVWKTVQKLEENGWQPIDDYIWYKTNPMPGHWPTRLRDGWEYCFHLAKVKKPYMNQKAVEMPIGDWADVRLRNLNGKSAQRHNSENESGFGRDLRRWVGKKNVLPSNVLSLPLIGINREHPAVFPQGLPTFFIKLLSPEAGTVLDPFAGSGTTAVAALNQGRNCILIDNNKEYCELAYEFILKDVETKKVDIVRDGF
jgi:DNA modification methylase